jgi:hypothetical protein
VRAIFLYLVQRVDISSKEVLTGKVPFQGLSDHQVYFSVGLKQLHPPRPNVDLEDGFWEILKSCWAPSPMERPSITDINERLKILYPDRKPHAQETFHNLPGVLDARSKDPAGAEAAPFLEDQVETPDGLYNPRTLRLYGLECIADFSPPDSPQTTSIYSIPHFDPIGPYSPDRQAPSMQGFNPRSNPRPVETIWGTAETTWGTTRTSMIRVVC